MPFWISWRAIMKRNGSARRRPPPHRRQKSCAFWPRRISMRVSPRPSTSLSGWRSGRRLPHVPAYKKRCSELKHRSLDRVVTLVPELAAERKVAVDAKAIARGLYAISDGCWVFSHVTGENSPEMRKRAPAALPLPSSPRSSRPILARPARRCPTWRDAPAHDDKQR